MNTQQPASVGMQLQNISTPALLVDLDAFEHNLQKLAQEVTDYGVRLRPHAKTHKSPDIANQQVAMGAVGCCCQTLAEAEALVAGGLRDVLISNQVIGSEKIKRLALLAKQASISVCVDNAENIVQLSNAATTNDVDIGVLVEVDIGMGRCGVPPGEPALILAKQVDSFANLRFDGIQAYHGRAQHLRDYEARRQAIANASTLAQQTKNLLKDNGLDCHTVAGAGTGTYPLESTSGVYNELQAGSYIFMDADYAQNLTESGAYFSHFKHSLYVLTSVISLPESTRAIVDAGLKAHSIDCGLPTLLDYGDISYFGPSDEHGNLDLSRSNHRFSLGEKLKLIPGHCDPTVNLYDWFIGIRDEVVECLWPIAARGPGA